MKFTNLIIIMAFFLCKVNAQGSWTQKADYGGSPICIGTGFSIGNKGYIGIGYCFHDDFWEWDQLNDVWTQKANVPGGYRSMAVGFSIGNKGYLGTGWTGTIPLIYYRDFWEYDPATNIWTQKADFGGIGRSGAIGFSIGNKGYIGLGRDTTGSFNDFWEYDTLTDTWTQKANFIGSCNWLPAGFSIGNKGYVGTGNGLIEFWEWDQTSDTWVQKANFGGSGRRGAVGFSIGNKGYIGTGGGGGNTLFKDFWEWDQTTNTWLQLSDFGGGYRMLGVAFSIGSKGYVGTGQDSLNRKDFWEFDPSISGVNEFLNQKTISLFPNPATDYITIKTNSNKKQLITITDITGQLIYTTTTLSDKTIINTKDFPQGVYAVQVQAGDAVQTRKIVVTR